MKILYAIQGTGNGHISRARDIIPVLLKKGEVDILISGTEAEVSLPYPVKYRYKGLSFVFGKKGGIDLLATYRKGNLKRIYDEILQLPVEDYDLVISDFEPVSSWACKLKHKQCMGLSHQIAVINSHAPKPRKADLTGKAVLKYYAPVTSGYGFHFDNYDKNIFTPVIRQEVRNLEPQTLDHYTIYLPAYSDKRIINVLTSIPDITWQVFSKNAKESYAEENVKIFPISNELFIKSLADCTGILCGAGFETPAEAIFLKKKLMVIPMKGQYEQQCNAEALNLMGIPVIKSLKHKHIDKIVAWTRSSRIVAVQYPDQTEHIIDTLIRESMEEHTVSTLPGGIPSSWKKFREMHFGKIIKKISR